MLKKIDHKFKNYDSKKLEWLWKWNLKLNLSLPVPLILNDFGNELKKLKIGFLNY